MEKGEHYAAAKTKFALAILLRHDYKVCAQLLKAAHKLLEQIGPARTRESLQLVSRLVSVQKFV